MAEDTTKAGKGTGVVIGKNKLLFTQYCAFTA